MGAYAHPTTQTDSGVCDAPRQYSKFKTSGGSAATPLILRFIATPLAQKVRGAYLGLFAELQQGGWNFCAVAGKNSLRPNGRADMNKIGKQFLQPALLLLCLLFIGAARQAPPIRSAPIQLAPIQHPAIQPEPIELLHEDASTPPAPHVVWMEVTAYCPCTKCCGPNAHGVTASGKDVRYNDGMFVAADTDRFAFGSKFSIPGYHDGQSVEVIDRGSAIKGDHLDVFFPTHDQALQWGRQRLPVTVVQ